MKKKIFIGVLIVFFVVVGLMFFSFEKDRAKLRNVLGIDRSNNYEFNLNEKTASPRDFCKIFNEKSNDGEKRITPITFIIHGHGDSIEASKLLAEEISIKLGHTTVACINPGFEGGNWQAISAFELWRRSTYHAVLFKRLTHYFEIFEAEKYNSVNLVGFSMGSHAVMYAGALSDEVDYTLGISGLTFAEKLKEDPAITQVVPGIYEEFTIGEISCMNKKMTWLAGKQDSVFGYEDAKKIDIPCSTVEVIPFDGGHEIPNEEVIKLLRGYK